MNLTQRAILLFLFLGTMYSCAVTKDYDKNTLALFSELVDTTPIFQENMLPDEVIISGQILELDTNEPVMFGSVALYDSDVLKQGVETDFDGHFSLTINSFDENADYKLACGYLGFKTTIITDINLSSGFEYQLNVWMEIDHSRPIIWHPHFKTPLIELDNTTSGQIFTSDEIRRRSSGGE